MVRITAALLIVVQAAAARADGFPTWAQGVWRAANLVVDTTAIDFMDPPPFLDEWTGATSLSVSEDGITLEGQGLFRLRKAEGVSTTPTSATVGSILRALDIYYPIETHLQFVAAASEWRLDGVEVTGGQCTVERIQVKANTRAFLKLPCRPYRIFNIPQRQAIAMASDEHMLVLFTRTGHPIPGL